MHTFNELVLALLWAHICADFIFQPDSLVHGKKRNSLRAYLAHAAIHYLLLIVTLVVFTPVPVTSLRTEIVLVSYIVVHLGIDFAKQQLLSRGKVKDSASTFIADQLAHLATMLVVASLLVPVDLRGVTGLLSNHGFMDRLLLVAVVYGSCIFAAGYLIRYLTRGLSSKMNLAPVDVVEKLQNAGLYIGWLERFLVISAIIMQSPALAGLVLTGKSIARFPEFKEECFAEYFLIGTLLSLSIAVTGGLIILKFASGAISIK
jgi:hypothetical protein